MSGLTGGGILDESAEVKQSATCIDQRMRSGSVGIRRGRLVHAQTTRSIRSILFGIKLKEELSTTEVVL